MPSFGAPLGIGAPKPERQTNQPRLAQQVSHQLGEQRLQDYFTEVENSGQYGLYPGFYNDLINTGTVDYSRLAPWAVPGFMRSKPQPPQQPPANPLLQMLGLMPQVQQPDYGAMLSDLLSALGLGGLGQKAPPPPIVPTGRDF